MVTIFHLTQLQILSFKQVINVKIISEILHFVFVCVCTKH